jgi:hypothetical protein
MMETITQLVVTTKLLFMINYEVKNNPRNKTIFSRSKELGLGIFLFTTVSGPALWPIQPPNQWIPGALSLEVKWPVHEANYSPPSSADIKNE